MKRTNCWVHPEFRKKLKVESSLRGMSITKYTEMLAKNDLKVDEKEENEKKRFKIRPF